MRAPADAPELFSFSDAFIDIAGPRLDARGRDTVKEFAAAWDAAYAHRLVVAGGGGAEDAWLATLLPGPRAEIPERVVGDVIGTRYVSTLLGLLFECARPPRARVGAPICPSAPTIVSTQGYSSALLGLMRSPDRFQALDAGPRFGAEPDVGRALNAIGDELVMSAVVVPSRIMPLAGLSNSEALARISRLSALAARPAPIALGVAPAEGGVHVTISASDQAIQDALTLFGSL
jgi:hypothetical protein